MLNQTNLAQNNNKFYVIQLLTDGSKFFVWNRWGRVGENGQNAMKGPFSKMADAEKDFAKKFKDKTGNIWSLDIYDDGNFVAKAGKYTLIHLHEDGDDEVDDAVAGKKKNKVAKKVNKDSNLPSELQHFVRAIYNESTTNMMNNLDCKITAKGITTPLGVLVSVSMFLLLLTVVNRRPLLVRSHFSSPWLRLKKVMRFSTRFTRN